MIPLLIVGALSVFKSATALSEMSRKHAQEYAENVTQTVESTFSTQMMTTGIFANNTNDIKVLAKVKEQGVEGAAGDLALLRQDMKQKFKVLEYNYLGI